MTVVINMHKPIMKASCQYAHPFK